jgi:hypothetical protein
VHNVQVHHASSHETQDHCMLLCRPARGDWVGLVGETFGDAAVRAMRQRMRDSPTGRQILADRPRVTVSLLSGGWGQGLRDGPVLLWVM